MIHPIHVILHQHLGQNGGREVERLLAQYQAAQITPWLAEAIQPIATDLKTKIDELEQAEAQARQAWEQAQTEATEAINKASAMGDGVSLTQTQNRLETARQASERHNILATATQDTRQARQKLEGIQKLLAELGQITAPDLESVRRIVRRAF